MGRSGGLRAVLLSVCIAGLVLAGCTSVDDESSSVSTATTAAAVGEGGSWLSVVSSGEATIDGGELTLTGVRTEVTLFTDRPSRQAHFMPTDDFVAAWAEMGFESDPPNASLTWTTDDGAWSTAVELANPRLNTDQLVFDVSGLAGGRGLPSGQTLAAATLTIDDGIIINPNELCFEIQNGEETDGTNQTLDSTCDFEGVDLTAVTFEGSIADGANFSNADMTGVNLSNGAVHSVVTRFAGAKMTGMNFSNTVFCASLKITETQTGENSWVVTDTKQCDAQAPTSIDFSGFDLSDVDFSGANLAYANLSGAVLTKVNFTNADLSNANLSNADLTGATTTGWDTTGANLDGAKGL